MATIGFIRVSTLDQDTEKNKLDILQFANTRKLGNVEFIEEKERQLQVNKITADTAKSDIVKQILDELERVSENEN